jgi:hypothetical protein
MEASVTWAVNGIQVGWGATGLVMDNTVDHHGLLENEDWTATGILVFESEGVSIRGNKVQHNETAIAVGAFGFFFPANNNKVVSNIVDDAVWGISLQSVAWSSTSDPTVSNNKVVNNTVKNTDKSGAIGIEVWTPDWSADYDPVADNNKIIHNEVDGFEIAISDEGTETKVHANNKPSSSKP